MDNRTRIWIASERMRDGTEVLHLGVRLPADYDESKVNCISFGHHVAESLEERARKMAQMAGMVIASSGNAMIPYVLENGDASVWRYQLAPVVSEAAGVFEEALKNALAQAVNGSKNGAHKH